MIFAYENKEKRLVIESFTLKQKKRSFKPRTQRI